MKKAQGVPVPWALCGESFDSPCEEPILNAPRLQITPRLAAGPQHSVDMKRELGPATPPRRRETRLFFKGRGFGIRLLLKLLRLDEPA
jgi:hypothetical protein